MADGSRQREQSDGLRQSKGDDRRRSISFVPWLTCFSLSALLVLVAAAFFQFQLTTLQEELAALKTNLSSCIGRREEEKTKVLKKRSPEESENEAGTNPGIRAAHLQGSLPFQHIQKQGRIGPWSLSSTDDSFLRLRGKSTEVEILRGGLYYVYAQVYYLTSQHHNSFQVLSYNGTERRQHRSILTCSSQGRNSVGEVSCYTGLVVTMHAGERLYLNQIEQDRIIQFSNGCSYFGIVLLKKNASLKQKK